MCFRKRCRTSRSLSRYRRHSSCRRVERVPTIEKNDINVEVHQLQFSYQVVDVQLSRNDERLQFRSGEHS